MTLVHGPTAAAAPASRDPALRRAAGELEAAFVGQLLKSMPFGFQAGAAQPFADLLIDEYGKLVARSGGVGLADAIVRQLASAREHSPRERGPLEHGR